jgi:hypothetical protein
MKGQKKIAVLAALLIFLASVSFAETKKLTRIGVNTFAQVRGNIPTADVMKDIAKRYASDIKIGFDQVGAGDLYLPFMDALNTATFTDKSLPIGDKFAWMLFRSKGKVKAWEDVEWAGKKPLDVFSFTATKDYKAYEFVIPKPCGNIALYKTTELKRPAPLAVCAISVSPAKANVNELISVDMGGTKNAVSMTVDVLTAQGAKVTSHDFTPAAAKWQTKFEKPGEYIFRATAVNEDGKVSDNPCNAKVYVNAPPVCKLTSSCLPCKDMVGLPITFDASGSSDPDGEIVKASFELTDEAGKVIDSFMDTQKPFVWEKIVNKAGKYGVSVMVFDDMGAASIEPCKLAVEITQKRLFILAELGGMLARGTYTGYIFGRLGLLFNLAPDTLDFIVRAGGAFAPKGDPWKFVFMSDALLNIHLGQAAYFDAGLGYSTKEQATRTSGFDLVGDFGVNVFNKVTSVGSVFAELRVPVLTSNRSFDEHHKLLLGFRYIF